MCDLNGDSIGRELKAVIQYGSSVLVAPEDAHDYKEVTRRNVRHKYGCVIVTHMLTSFLTSTAIISSGT